jgi:hypothetical protein
MQTKGGSMACPGEHKCDTSMQSPFRTKKGTIIIAQKPNAPLVIWGVALCVSWLPIGSVGVSVAHDVSFGAICTWCYLEIRSGVNIFRRVLGVVVLVTVLYMRVV